MTRVRWMLGGAGWPMSVFLTPELKPFYGGTYWPPAARMGMPGFGQVIDAVSHAWKNKRESVLEQAGELSQHLIEAGDLTKQADAEAGKAVAAPTVELLRGAATALERSF